MTGRTATAQVVSRGKIRVDARRAVAKLREHLLLDLHSYLLEVVRAAVAGGARSIDVDYDADDVTVTWAGQPGDPDMLCRLLDLVLAEAAAGPAQPWRLLALGVNAALGLEPSFVDVYAAGHGDLSACARIRWRPELLEQSPDAAITPQAEPVPLPATMPPSGMRVHVRRRFSWSVLRGAAMGDVPCEVGALVSAAKHLDATLTVRGQSSVERIRSTQPSSRATAPLLRVPFDVHHTRRAWLDILAPGPDRPLLEFLEQGVRLVAYHFTPGPGWPAEPHADLALPVQVVVDAPLLPTNASRSAVRHDDPLFVRALGAAQSAYVTAIDGLTRLVFGDGKLGDGLVLGTEDRSALEDALAAIICVAVGAQRRGEELSDGARALLDLPVLHDGCGRPRAYSSLVAGVQSPLYLHRASTPLEPALGFWMRDVVWQRGRVAERGLTGLALHDARSVVKHARAAAKRRERFLAHPPGDVRLPASNAHLCSETFAVDSGRFAGLRGEVALFAPGVGVAGSTVRVFVEGRQLGSGPVTPEVIPLSLDAALSWDGRFQVSFGFDGVEADDAFRYAIWYAVQLAAMQARGLAERFAELGDDWHRTVRPLLRAAIGAALTAGTALNLRDVLPAEMGADDPLFAAPCWPTTERDRYESLATLFAYAERTGAVCVARPRTRGRALDGRPVVAVDRGSSSWLAAALGDNVTLVPYDAGVIGPKRQREQVASGDRELRKALLEARPEVSAHCAPALPFSSPAGKGLIGIARHTSRVLLHAGKRLASKGATRRFGPVTIVFDDAHLVPTPDWQDALHSSGEPSSDDLELQLLMTIVASLEGDPKARARLLDPPQSALKAGWPLQCYLLDSAVGLRGRIHHTAAFAHLAAAFFSDDDDEASATAPRDDGVPANAAASAAEQAALTDLWDRLQAVPLLPMLDEAGRPRPASLAAIAAAHDASIPVVERTLGFATLDWQPVLIDDAQLEVAFGQWAGTGMSPASPHDVSVRRLIAERDRGRRELLAKPQLDPQDLSDLLPAGAGFAAARTLYRSDEDARPSSSDDGPPDGAAKALALDSVASAAVALVPGEPARGIRVEVLFHGRALCRHILSQHTLPVVARVNLVDEEHCHEWTALSDAGSTAVDELVLRGAMGLAHGLVDRAHEERSSGLVEDGVAVRLLHGMLHLSLPAELDDARRRLSVKLRDVAMRWPTTQGKDSSWSTLLRAGAQIYTATTRFSPWLARAGRSGRSELDRPVLLVPAGAAGEDVTKLVAGLNMRTRDVTAAVEKLQAQRAQSAAPAEAPTLTGEPPHRALRASLASLRIHACEGELEIIDGSQSELSLADLEGPARRVAVELTIPCRVVARLDTVLTERLIKTISRQLERGAVGHLRSLGDTVERLPDFARHHYRRFLCSELPAHRTDESVLEPADRAARIFPDTTGRWWSLDELCEQVAAEQTKTWWFTHEPPPYPERDYRRAILRLAADDDLSRLRLALPLRNMTQVLANDLQGEMRARAPQRDSFVLPAELRSRCLRVFSVELGAVRGEIGILAAADAEARGLGVFTHGRPLCKLSDRPGWPLIGRINDDTLRPNRSFDGIHTRKQEARLRRAVRAAADAQLEGWLPAPQNALAAHWVDTSRAEGDEQGGAGAARSATGTPEATEAEGLQHLVVGRLWLPVFWPVEPAVRIRTAARPAGDLLPLRLLVRPAQLDGRLPICGDVLVIPAAGVGDVHQTLVKLATEALATMMGELQAAGSATLATCETYRWDLALLDELSGDAPTVEACGGDRLTPVDVLTELTGQGCLWFSEGRGTDLGEFPDREPSFVLPGGTPLHEVLRHRALGRVLHELGGLSSEGLEERAATAPSLGRTPPDVGEPIADPYGPHGDGLGSLAGGEVAVELHDDDRSESWLDGLVKRVTQAFSDNGPARYEAATTPPELGDAVLSALTQLSLTGDPVYTVSYAGRGRPVRYEPSTRQLWLRPSHPAVRALGRDPRDAAAIALLVAAAVSEVNRALEPVTDDEEHRALVDLLAARSGES